MDRRHFLGRFGACCTFPFLPTAFGYESLDTSLRIQDIQMLKVTGRRSSFDFPYQNQVSPLSIYPEHRLPPYPKNKTVAPETYEHTTYYLKILTNQGVEGFYGLIDAEAAYVVMKQLRSFLIDKNPLAIETLWDKMYRVNRHARSGHFMMAISAVDNALWDLKGNYYKVPVYELLGGPTRQKLPVYASCLGFSVVPEDAAEKSLEIKKLGYKHQKWFFAKGLADGTEGLLGNVQLVKSLREALGESYEIMFDAFSGWDLNYAQRWAQMVEPYRPYWIEEAFSSDKIASFAELKKSTSVPVATGEHFYNRWEAMHYLQNNALDYIQADPEWCGGVSELVKICTLASAFDVRVVPHGHNIHAALHVVASQSPMTCPLVEYLLNWMPSKIFFEKDPPKVVNGHLELPTRPGFGIVLDQAKIDKQELVTF